MLLKEVLFFETSFDLICHEDRGSVREGGLRRCHLSRTALAGAAWHLYMCAVGWGEEQALRRLRGTRCGGSPPGGVSVPREGPGALSGRALLPFRLRGATCGRLVRHSPREVCECKGRANGRGRKVILR